MSRWSPPKVVRRGATTAMDLFKLLLAGIGVIALCAVIPVCIWAVFSVIAWAWNNSIPVLFVSAPHLEWVHAFAFSIFFSVVVVMVRRIAFAAKYPAPPPRR